MRYTYTDIILHMFGNMYIMITMMFGSFIMLNNTQVNINNNTLPFFDFHSSPLSHDYEKQRVILYFSNDGC